MYVHEFGFWSGKTKINYINVNLVDNLMNKKTENAPNNIIHIRQIANYSRY